jgi:hypothetical protein
MAIKFTEDTATDLRFPYGDYREVEGNFGPQFMYTVEGGTGHTDRLFASPDLHRALQRDGVGPGSELRITATRGENRRRVWHVTPAVTRREPMEGTDITQDRATSGRVAEPSPDQRIEIHRPQPANSNGHRHQAADDGDDGQPDAELPNFDGNGDGRPPLPRELDQMGQLMGLCLHASTRAWKRVIHGRQSAGDVRAVAITLFLECSRKGVTPEELLHDIAA